MKIGIVVHGPQIVDSGYAIKIIEMLKKYGEVKARLGGTMGRTAVIDASLEKIIDIKHRLLPSESVKSFKDKTDLIFLLDYGKSSITGHAFGFKVYHKSDKPKLLQIERPGEKDGAIVIWDKNFEKIAKEIAKEMKLKTIYPNEIKEKLFPEFKNEKTHSYLIEKNKRKISGVNPNENIFINGLVVGKTTSDNLILITENGILTDMEGGTIKKHGVEKLGKFDLNTAIVKTGLLRRADVKPRKIKTKHNKKVAFLDHAAEDIYSLKDNDLVITVGDDTTSIASDILFRFSVPIIGITDGDLDKVIEKSYKHEDSIIIELESGWDDKIGKEIFKKIFNYKEEIYIDNKEELINNILDMIKEKKISYLLNGIKQS